jgi:hypothetical protein
MSDKLLTEAIKSAHSALASWVGDVSAHRKTEWAYLIVSGASDEQIDDAASRHGYEPEDVERLRSYCRAVRELEAQ